MSALEADGKGKIISSPRVITADQIKALIEQGEELPYQVATSSGATSIQFRKANLKLEVTPQITPEGNVILDVDVNKDSVGRNTAAGFAIDTKHVKTQVLVENGGTVVIGGIFTQNERDEVNKVPLLGDVPVIGYLFKNTMRTANKTELLVFLTPRSSPTALRLADVSGPNSGRWSHRLAPGRSGARLQPWPSLLDRYAGKREVHVGRQLARRLELAVCRFRYRDRAADRVHDPQPLRAARRGVVSRHRTSGARGALLRDARFWPLAAAPSCAKPIGT